MYLTGLQVEPAEVVLHEVLVADVLVDHVELDDVVEAVGVGGVVVLEAAATDGVLDLDTLELGVVDLLALEDQLLRCNLHTSDLDVTPRTCMASKHGK